MKRCFLIILAMSLALISSAQQTDSFTDERDGKLYKTVTIGNQIWMSENLAFKVDEGCWVYDNNPENVNKYGYLYNWKTAKLVCPSDWRLPTKNDFISLVESVGKKGKVAFQALIPGGSSGFSATFGGWVKENGTNFKNTDEYGLYWSSSPFKLDGAEFLSIDSRFKIAGVFGNGFRWYGYSVRCIKDK